jgi:hypothetical protein
MKATWCTIPPLYVISILYMFRATICPSSGEITMSIRHLLFVTVCEWPSGMHTRRSSTQSDKYRVSYWYRYFSWWWTHSCPKHVQNRNKHTKKDWCTKLVLFRRLYKDARSTNHQILQCLCNYSLLCMLFLDIMIWLTIGISNLKLIRNAQAD